MSTINPATGFVRNSAADKAAMKGAIAKKPVATTSPKPMTSTPTTGVKTNIGTTAVTQAGADRVNARANQRTTGTTFTPTPGIDPTTNKPNTTVTGGVPIPVKAGTTNYQSSPTNMSDSELDISIIKKQLARTAQGQGLSEAELDRLARRQYDATTAAQRQADEAAIAYGQSNAEAERFAAAEQRRLENEQRRLAQETDRAVVDYSNQIDPMFEGSRQRMREEGGQRASIQERLMGAQGNATSQFAVQELTKIEQDTTRMIAAIDAEKMAKVDLFRAQREGADGQTISALMQGVSNARIAANNAKQQSITDLYNIRMQAEQTGNQAWIDWTESMAEQMISDTDPIDIERSKIEGILLYTDGQPYFDSSGKTVQYDSSWEKSGIVKSAGGQQSYMFVNPNTLEHKLIPLPAGDAPGSGGAGSGGTVLSLNPKTLEYSNTSRDAIPAGNVLVSVGNQQADVADLVINKTSGGGGLTVDTTNLPPRNTPAAGGGFNFFRKK